MALTKKEIHDLNNMNRAAQNVQLGTILNEILETGGSGGDYTAIVQKPTYFEFPNVGSEKVLYIATNNNISYRWDSTNKKYYEVGFNSDNIKKISGGDANGR